MELNKNVNVIYFCTKPIQQKGMYAQYANNK